MGRSRDDTTPRLAPVEPRDLADAEANALMSGRAEGLRVTGDATGADLAAASIDECVLDRVVLDDAGLDRARITDSVLSAVTATAVRGARSSLRDVRLDGCRIGAAELYESDWNRVLVTGCRIDYLSLADGTLADVRFEDCTIGDLDLRGAGATRIAFADCRVAAVSLAGARLSGVDLRGADLERIDGATHLAGAIVSEEQLPRFAQAFAEALGVSVR